MEEIHFLSPDDVILMHGRGLELFGGEPGLRDRGLLESAVFAPQQTFGGEYLYTNIYLMAAALWHGIVCNHPFIDGNKRAGALAADVFLLTNGIRMNLSNRAVVAITLDLATHDLSREDLADLLSRNSEVRLGE